MLIIVAITSVLSLTVLVWLANRQLPFQICPICAGVSGTWIWLMVAYFLGYQIVLTIPARLLGGWVVGAMSKLERFVQPKFVLVWKTIFVVSGFLAANGLLTGNWPMVVGGIILASIATLTGRTRPGKIGEQKSEPIKDLEKKMKNCC